MSSKKSKGKSEKKTAKSTKKVDEKAIKASAEKEAQKKEVEAKADAEAKLEAEKKIKKKNPEDLKPFSELTTITYRQLWDKKELIEFVQKTYKGFDVEVIETNPRQISFKIDGIKVPKDGDYSVK